MSVRRVVTGHDVAGSAKILIDDDASNRKVSPAGSVAHLIRYTGAMNARISLGEDAEDMGARLIE